MRCFLVHLLNESDFTIDESFNTRCETLTFLNKMIIIYFGCFAEYDEAQRFYSDMGALIWLPITKWREICVYDRRNVLRFSAQSTAIVLDDLLEPI